MSITSDIRIYILANCPTITSILEDSFGTVMDAIMMRSDPSTANKIEFIDGSYQGTQQITFYARNKNPAIAQSQLASIRECVDKKEIALTNLQSIRVQSVSTVSFVSKEDTGESIYSTTVIVDYDGKNPV